MKVLKAIYFSRCMRFFRACVLNRSARVFKFSTLLASLHVADQL